MPRPCTTRPPPNGPAPIPAPVTDELRKYGVEVVDAPPEELAPKLADAYLALKAAGRL